MEVQLVAFWLTEEGELAHCAKVVNTHIGINS